MFPQTLFRCLGVQNCNILPSPPNTNEKKIRNNPEVYAKPLSYTILNAHKKNYEFQQSYPQIKTKQPQTNYSPK